MSEIRRRACEVCHTLGGGRPVILCALHGAAQEMLESLKEVQGWFELGQVSFLIRHERGEAADYDRIVRKYRAAIAAAEKGEGG